MERIAVVTGGSSGIGEAIVNMLTSHNIICVLLGTNDEILEKKCNENKKIFFFHLNLMDSKEIELVCNKIISKFYNVDILINCAGIAGFNNVIDMDESMLRKTININLIGTILLTQKIAKQMIICKQGQIINVESIAADKAFSFGTPYVVSKYGMNGFTHVLWQELKKYEIKVCSIKPGLVNSPFYNDLKGKYDLSEALKPEDVAHVVKTVVDQSEFSNISEIILRPIKKSAQNLFTEIINNEYGSIRSNL